MCQGPIQRPCVYGTGAYGVGGDGWMGGLEVHAAGGRTHGRPRGRRCDGAIVGPRGQVLQVKGQVVRLGQRVQVHGCDAKQVGRFKTTQSAHLTFSLCPERIV